MWKLHGASESEDVYLSSHSNFNKYGTNYVPRIMHIMKKKISKAHIVHFYPGAGDFILFLAPVSHEGSHYFDRSSPPRNPFHLRNTLFSLRKGLYGLCIAFP